MSKSIFVAGFVLASAVIQSAPAPARTIHRYHAVKSMNAGKYMAGTTMTAPSVTVPLEVKPLTGAALDGERAMLWQDSLHGSPP